MTTTPSSIEIPLSKSKLARLIGAALVFVVLGILFILRPQTFTNSFSGNSIVIVEAVGIAALVFFGICLLFMIKRYGDKRPALIINESGITDHSSAIPAGFIPWSHIQDIVEIEIYKNRLLLIKVKDPSLYINRHTGFLKRKAVEVNYKTYGTPVCIGSQAIQYNFDDLKALLHKKLAEFQRPPVTQQAIGNGQ